MNLELTGKVAVVTGGSKGSASRSCGRSSKRARNSVVGANTVEALAGMEDVSAIAVDLAEPGGSERLVGEALERHGRLDVFVNRDRRNADGPLHHPGRGRHARRVARLSPHRQRHRANYVIDGGLIKTI